MTTKSMASRIQRVQASARRKKMAELESKPELSARKRKIAELEASLKKAEGAKSESTDKDDGKGAKPGATAADKYDRKKNQPKPKGDKADAKLDKPTGDAKPDGYPFKGNQKGGLGKGEPKDTKKSKQQALNDADAKRKELTSETPPLKATPKPKLSSTKEGKKTWRRTKIAELKKALMGQTPDAEMDTTELGDKDVQDVSGKASKEQRVPAAKVLEQAKKIVPMMTQELQQANDVLEEAIMGNNLQKIKGALTLLLTKIQNVTKSEIVPLGATIRKLMSMLSPKQAASTKFASVVEGSRIVAKLDEEFARSKHLMRMAANRISL
jgi:hypothetical protein